jgi:hypothetical protein
MMERIIKEYSYLSEIFFVIHFNMRGCRARDRMVVNLQLPMHQYLSPLMV